MNKKIFKISKIFFTVLPSQEPPNFFTKRFSIRNCIIIKKNPEVPERLTGTKFNLSVLSFKYQNKIYTVNFVRVVIFVEFTHNSFRF